MSELAIVLLGHGSRVAAANRGLDDFVDAVRAARPAAAVVPAFVELAPPDLATALAEAAARAPRVVVAPVFLFTAGHLKNDVPLALARARARFPQAEFLAARPLGVHPILAELALARANAAGLDRPEETVLVMVGRGSSDPDANSDFCKLARLTGEGGGVRLTLPCFAGITEPRLGPTLELAARGRPRRILVVPYLLHPGRVLERLAAEVASFAEHHPWVRTHLAAPLAPDARLARVLGERIDEALEGRAPLPCDTCTYRHPIGQVADVDGLRALLWSVRHTVTHHQAMPHEHAHKSLRKHVLVCGNADCAGRGSLQVLVALRRAVKRSGKQAEIRVTRTSCLGRCGEGPTVSVYPDGVWYRGVRASDADELVDHHLLGDRLVARLVDDIMQ